MQSVGQQLAESVFHFLTCRQIRNGIITLLGISSNLARVKVSANGNIFFNVSGTFTLLAPCGPVDYNGDGVLNADDLSDYVTGTVIPIDGGMQR